MNVNKQLGINHTCVNLKRSIVNLLNYLHKLVHSGTLIKTLILFFPFASFVRVDFSKA